MVNVLESIVIVTQIHGHAAEFMQAEKIASSIAHAVSSVTARTAKKLQ